MKKVFLMISCFILSFILFDCSSPKYVVSEKGDKAEVELKDGKDFSGEIVLISDTSIIFSNVAGNSGTGPILFYILNKNIKHISVKGYNGSGWITPVLIFQVLPAALLAIAASSVKYTNENNTLIAVILSIPALVTPIIFALTEGETPHWDDSMPLNEIKKLKIYSRYPLELSPTQMELLLKIYNQKKIREYY